MEMLEDIYPRRFVFGLDSKSRSFDRLLKREENLSKKKEAFEGGREEKIPPSLSDCEFKIDSRRSLKQRNASTGN